MPNFSTCRLDALGDNATTFANGNITSRTFTRLAQNSLLNRLAIHLSRFININQTPTSWRHYFSETYAVLGEKDSALKEAERAIMLLPRTEDRVYGPGSAVIESSPHPLYFRPSFTPVRLIWPIFQVTAETKAHRRKQLVDVVSFTT